MSSTPDKTSLLIIGSGEIARLLVTLAQHADYAITVCDNNADQYHWPSGVTTKSFNFSEHAWLLNNNTHAVIARGHQADTENLTSLLQHNASHIYLVASAARAQGIIDQVTPLLSDHTQLDRLSAPAGLSLGGQSSYEIAISILAEIQWRRHGQANIQTLTNLRASRVNNSISGQRNKNCPGKRA